jgi:two-component system, NarL family, response regulator LiaR
MKKIRVLLVEDQAVVREGVAAILSYQKDIEVVGQAKDGIEAIELLKQTKPDVVLLDLVMPRQDGLQTIPIIKELMPEAHVLILTSFADNDRVYQAIKLGAEGYMLKDATHEQLLQGIHDVAAGEASIYPSIAIRVIREINNPPELTFTTDPLTPRELDTLRHIANGLSNQEIAQKLFVQESTVAKYVSSILNKLQLANRTQAALYAMKKGISTYN